MATDNRFLTGSWPPEYESLRISNDRAIGRDVIPERLVAQLVAHLFATLAQVVDFAHREQPPQTTLSH